MMSFAFKVAFIAAIFKGYLIDGDAANLLI